jgi:plasmid stabilization system protein ParE
MPPRITRSAKARSDLLEHYVYIGRDSMTAARRFLKAAKRAMEKLARIPRWVVFGIRGTLHWPGFAFGQYTSSETT